MSLVFPVIRGALLVAAVLLAGPSVAGAVRCVENSAWTAAKSLRATFDASPRPTAEDRRAVDGRWGPLAAEQKALLAQACQHDAEHQSLGQERPQVQSLKSSFQSQCGSITSQAQLSACQSQLASVNAAVNAYNARLADFNARDRAYGNQVRAWVEQVNALRNLMQEGLAREDLLLKRAQALDAENGQLLARARGAAQGLEQLRSILSTMGGSR